VTFLLTALAGALVAARTRRIKRFEVFGFYFYDLVAVFARAPIGFFRYLHIGFVEEEMVSFVLFGAEDLLEN